jgi:biotin carboxyl carrier protein
MDETKSQQARDEVHGLKKLNIQGDTYLTTYTRKFETRRNWMKPDQKKVISFIPGTIRQIMVKSGDQVKAEDKLLVLEAMKMMNTIQSPMPGTIRSVLVREGDKIPKGFIMIEFR